MFLNHARRIRLSSVALAAVLAMAAGAAAAQPAYAPPAPATTAVDIAAMPSYGPVMIRGSIEQVFGNKFLVRDGSGRTLVDAGKAGEGGGLVALNENVTVHGRFERGYVRADGRTDVLREPGKGGKHHRDGRHGDAGRHAPYAQPVYAR